MENGDFHKFSFMNTSVRHLKQLQCWTCFTNEEAHNVLRNGLADSPLFNGQIQSIGRAIALARNEDRHLPRQRATPAIP